MEKGKLIIFEGIDGAGKSTQAYLLKDKLLKMNKKVILTAEPTYSHFGSEIRNIINGNSIYTKELLPGLILTDRIYHNINSENGIQKYIDNGYYVICDRYYYSNIVYQGTDCNNFNWIKDMNINCPYILKPDICILLSIDYTTALERMQKSQKNLDIYETKTKLIQVAESYENISKSFGNQVIVINAKDTQEKVHERIWKIISKIL